MGIWSAQHRFLEQTPVCLWLADSVELGTTWLRQVLLLDVLFCFSFAFFLCGFRKVKFHIAVYVVPVVLMVILALASGEGGFGELIGFFFGSRHT